MLKIKRIIIWIIAIAITLSFTFLKQLEEKNKQKKQTEPEKIQVQLSEEFKMIDEEDIIKIFKKTEIGDKYDMTINYEPSEKDDVVISSEYSKHLEDSEVIGYSPLVVAIGRNKGDIKKYAEAGLLTSNEEIEGKISDETDIDFKEIIKAVINGENWSKFGGDKEEIRILYPELDTIDGELFYEFLLITVNGGKYPKTDEDMEKTKEYIDEFLSKPNVQSVDMQKRLEINSGDITNDVYCAFENTVMKYADTNSVYVAYPKETIIKEINLQSKTEKGRKFEKIISEEVGFLGSWGSIKDNIIINNKYRTSTERAVENLVSNLNVKNTFNYVKIPEKTKKTEE